MRSRPVSPARAVACVAARRRARGCESLLRATFPAVVILLLAGAPARADFTATGTFMYEDLPIDINGFQSPHVNRPCRLVDVNVIDTNTFVILAQGATDQNGLFSINVTDSQVRNVAVLALTSNVSTPNLQHYVTQFNTTAIHAFQGIQVASHGPGDPINMGTVVMRYRSGGEAFNLYDVALDGADFIASLEGGVRPPVPLRIRFSLDVSPNVGYYNGDVNMGGNFGYDDTILLHEMGHYVQNRYGNFSDNPGGTHYIGDSAQDPRLSFGEGWPTFWGSNVRDWLGMNQPQVYLTSTGDSTTGVINFSYDLETYAGCTGAACEVAVQGSLWDMTDGNTTQDRSPGVDDEPGYQMDRPFGDLWTFTRTYLSQPPFSGDLTYEDFHLLWVQNVNPPQATELGMIEDLNHGIQYRPDAFESDNGSGQAAASHSFEDLSAGNTTHHTTWIAGDEDWVRFSGQAGITYQIETRTMRDGADTYLEVRNAALALVASSDNVGTPSPGQNNAFEVLRSSTTWIPPATQDVYVMVRRSSAAPYGIMSLHGNYDLRIKAMNVPATYPNVTVTPLFFSITLNQNTQTTRNMVVGNTGTADALTYNLVEAGGDIPWVSAAPLSGTVPPGETRTSVVTFDATGLAVGNYSGTLEVHSNDPDNAVRNMALVLRVDPGTTAADDAPGAPATWLAANTPNPVNPATTIRFTLRAAGPVSLAIYDVQGREVERLVSGVMSAGEHAVEWNSAAGHRPPLASGVYFYRLTAGDFTATRKMAVIR
jgi:hypothetical protein